MGGLQRGLGMGLGLCRRQAALLGVAPAVQRGGGQAGQAQRGHALLPAGLQRGQAGLGAVLALGQVGGLLLQALLFVQPHLQGADITRLVMALVGQVVGVLQLGVEAAGCGGQRQRARLQLRPGAVAQRAGLGQVTSADQVLGAALLQDLQRQRAQA